MNSFFIIMKTVTFLKYKNAFIIIISFKILKLIFNNSIWLFHYELDFYLYVFDFYIYEFIVHKLAYQIHNIKEFSYSQK